MSEVPPAACRNTGLNLKALLQNQPARLKPDVHQPGAGEIGVSENRNHRSLRILPRRVGLRKYDILHRHRTSVHFAYG